MRPHSFLVSVLSLGAALGAQAPKDVVHLDTPGAAGSLGMNLSSGPGGVYLSWLEPTKPRVHALRWAKLEGDRWGEARNLVEGRELLANWADVPSVVSGDHGLLLAHWLAEPEGGRFGYGIELALSRDAGETWKRLGSPHRDNTASEHGFVSILPEAGGFRVFWLDGREMTMGGAGKMTLRSCLVGDELGEELVLDADVCTCCPTGAAATPAGAAIVYRDHQAREIRDISIICSTESGWSEPQTVHRDGWQIRACPVNGPSISVHGDLMAVAWFTAAADMPSVRVAFSRDHGRQFGAAITLDEADSQGREGPLGRAAVVAVGEGAVVGWLGTEGDDSVFRVRHVTPEGAIGPRIDIGRTGSNRSSGFPRMIARGNDILVAWRETGEPARLRTALLPAALLSGGQR